MLCVGQHFLDFVVGVPVDDRVMNILKDQPIFLRIINAPVVLERLGMCFEVQNVSAILLSFQNVVNRSAFPFVRIWLLFFATAIDTLSYLAVKCANSLLIKELSLLDMRPLSEYISGGLQFGGDL